MHIADLDHIHPPIPFILSAFRVSPWSLSSSQIKPIPFHFYIYFSYIYFICNMYDIYLVWLISAKIMIYYVIYD